MKYVSRSITALALIFGLIATTPPAHARYDWDSGDNWGDHGHDNDGGADFSIGSLGIAPDSGFTITVETPNGIAQHSGQTTRIRGQVHVNGLKGKRKHQTLEDMLTDRGVALKFYFPDMLHEVTSHVNVDEGDLTFTYTTPALASGDLNTFIAIVTATASNLPRLQRTQAKIDLRIQKFTELLAAHENSGLRKLIDSLKAISARVTAKIAGSTKTLAETRFPLQVDNRIAQTGYTSTLMGKFRLEITATPGSAIEGMKAQFLGVVTNLRKPDPDDDAPDHNDSQDKWITRFFWEGDKVKEIGPQIIPNGQGVSYSFTSDALSAGNAGAQNAFGIQLYSVERNHGHDEIDKRFAHLSWDQPVLSDNVPPRWLAGGNLQNSFEKTALPVSATIQDTVGLVDQATIKAVLTGTENSGASINLDVTGKFSIASPDQGQTHNLSGEINPLAEGAYTLSFYGSDLAGNTATPLASRFSIDRTPPVVTLGLQSGGFSNSPNFSLPIVVTDRSPSATTITLNGAPLLTTDAISFTASATLQEGLNIFEITSTDAAGNASAPLTFLWTVDSTPPRLSNLKPIDGTVISTLSVTVSGQASEALSAASVNGVALTLSQDMKAFSGTVSFMAEGSQPLAWSAIDLAGNVATTTTTVQILRSVLNASLITIQPNSDGVHLNIVGAPGAARGLIAISASASFLNSGSTTSAANGSFLIKLSTFRTAVVTATDPSIGRTDTATVAYNVETRLAGSVQDTSGQPIPGVTVSIAGTSPLLTSVTDASGVFSFPNPPTGDQKLVIDGTTYQNAPAPAPQRRFAKANIAVSVGVLQSNVISRPIYLQPIPLDGSAITFNAANGGTITSPTAPGVSIDIPPGVAKFPDGAASGLVYAATISAQYSTIAPFEFASPNNVVALEPSGMRFTSDVQVTLPNSNELPAGTDMLILSLNTVKGIWEIGGVATVTGDGHSIVTKSGMGLRHFSVIYATPGGPKVVAGGSQIDRPGSDTFNGALSTSIAMPSYKSLGQSISPSLIYKSTWARPTALTTNIFDIPRNEFNVELNTDFFGEPDVYTLTDIEIAHGWYEPDHITAQFSTTGIIGSPVTFTGVPNQAVVSYSIDLVDPNTNQYLSSGMYPYDSHWDVYLREMILRTRKIRLWQNNGTTFGANSIVRQDNWVETHQLEKAFPQDLEGVIPVQNQVNSSAGRGWRVGGYQTILNPQANRILVEEADGSAVNYTINNTIDTVYNVVDGPYPYADMTFGVGFSYPNAVIYQSETYGAAGPVTDGGPINIDLTLGAGHGEHLTATPASFSGHMKGYDCYDTGSGCYSYPDWLFTGYRRPGGLFLTSSGTVFGADHLGSQIFKVDPSAATTTIAGLSQVPPTLYNAYPTFRESSECINKGNVGLGSPYAGFNTAYYQSYYICGNNLADGNQQMCSFVAFEGPGCSYGTAPAPGYADGAASTAQFNKPMGVSSGSQVNTIVVADTGNNVVRVVDLTANTVTTVAGNGQTTDFGDGGLATAAGIYHPRGVVYDSLGNLFISSENGYIRKVDPTGHISTFAGKALADGGTPGEGVPAKSALLMRPTGLVVDNDHGILYFADTGNNVVRAVDFQTETIQTVAGNYEVGFNGDGKPALSASLSNPLWVGLDSSDNILIADAGNKRIRRVNFQAIGNANARLAYAPTSLDHTTLTRNGDGTWARGYRNGTRVYYDANGRQVSAVDRAQRNTAYFYDTNGRISAIQDSSGQMTTYNYGGNFLSSIVDPAGRVTQFTYTSGYLTQVIFPDGTSRSYTYNAQGLLQSETSERGLPTQYVYNQWNRLQQVVRADNSTVTVNDSGSATASNGYTGGTVGKLQTYGTGQGQVYDGILDPKSIETKFLKDTNGFVTEIVDARGLTTSIQVDSKGKPTLITRPDNTTVSFAYDPNTDDLLSSTDTALNRTTSQTYDGYGNILSKTNGRGFSSHSSYDSNTGFLKNYTDPVNHITAYNYLPNSLLLGSTTNFRGESTTYSYDALGNTATTKDPLGHITLQARDLAGNVTTVTNANQQVVHIENDVWNRPIVVISPKGERVEYTYLPGTTQPIQIKDPLGNIIHFDYDTMNRLVKKTDQLGFASTRSYDQSGNLLQEVDANGTVKSFEYDSLNELITKTLPDNVYNFSYNIRGKLLQASNSNSLVKFTYDDGSRVISAVAQGLGNYSNLPSVLLSFAYDANNNRVQMNDSVGASLYAYDQVDRLTGLTNPKGENFNFSYDDLGNKFTLNRPGSQSVYTLDARGLLASISHLAGGSPISSFNFQWDGIGNLVNMTNKDGVIKSFGYDQDNQLTTSTNPEATTQQTQNETFTYDPISNRTQDSGGNYTYDHNSQRLKEDYHYFYFYDNNGNLISKQSKGLTGDVTNFSYSSENQLLGYKVYLPGSNSPVKEVSYAYDVLGRRMQKVVVDHTAESDPTKTFSRSYVYDGQDIIQEYDGSNNLLARYTHSTLGADDVLAVDVRQAGVNAKLARSTGTYEYLKDHLGSIVDILDTAGNRLQHYIYSAFGMLIGIQDAFAQDISANPVLNTSFTYTGREFDSESGYYYYRARFYDSAAGRFLQKDPNPGILSLPVSVINSYVYGANNPLRHTDPSGQSFWNSTFGKIVIGVVMAAAIAFTAGAAAAFVVAELAVEGALAGALVGAAVGAVVGGIVGGTLNVALGQGSFTQGFIKGAISGAIAGGIAGGFQGAANVESAAGGSSAAGSADGAAQSPQNVPADSTSAAPGSVGTDPSSGATQLAGNDEFEIQPRTYRWYEENGDGLYGPPPPRPTAPPGTQPIRLTQEYVSRVA